MKKELSKRQKEIIRQAIALIAKRGIQNLTIRNLAYEMGFSEPAIYRHFSSKNEILLTIIGGFKEDRRQDESEITPSFSESLENIFLKHTSLFESEPAYATVVFSEDIFRNDPYLIKEMQEVMNQNENEIRILVERAQKVGEVQQQLDSHSLTIMIMGSMRLLVKKWIFSGFSFNLNQQVKQLHATFIKLTEKV